ncbi:MAG: hypothetical protein PUG22_04500 [Peptoniphilaceae bacterium]|nr:hypothetical protein [Peptoniphilaceae bacterium]
MAINESYEEFEEKFKSKLTTDDCYTPFETYDAVKNWAVNQYKLEGLEIVRPFFPGGDYENYNYPKDCVVIDNPPFSKLSSIKEFFFKNNIKFFLFAPSLSLFASSSKNLNYSFVVTGQSIVFENKANVAISFVTNLDDCFIRLSFDLKEALKDANRKVRKRTRKKDFKKYKYPDNVISSALLNKYVKHANLKIYKDQCYFTRQLDSQAEKKKGKRKIEIYGGGFIVSDGVKDMLLKAHQKEDEDYYDEVWTLSDREKEIIKELNKNDKKYYK